jgi:hypothetical protein
MSVGEEEVVEMPPVEMGTAAGDGIQPTTSEEVAVPPTRQRAWGESAAFVLLLGVLILGGIFRFTGLAWDENHHLHPDERFLTSVANKLQPTYNPLTYLRTSQSPLNPYNVNEPFYVYGNFPMTATRLIAEWVQKACGNFEGGCDYTYTAYDGVHLVGRALAGVMDLLTILFIFFIGRRLYSWPAGLIAALLYALAVMPIQQSHFFTMDTWAVAWTAITMYTAVRASEERGAKSEERGERSEERRGGGEKEQAVWWA